MCTQGLSRVLGSRTLVDLLVYWLSQTHPQDESEFGTRVG